MNDKIQSIIEIAQNNKLTIDECKEKISAILQSVRLEAHNEAIIRAGILSRLAYGDRDLCIHIAKQIESLIEKDIIAKEIKDTTKK